MCVTKAKGIWQDGQADQRGKLVWSKRRLQTLVARSDGKGKEEKQVPAFRKMRLMTATRILKAKRDSDPLFPEEPCPVIFFLVPRDPL